MCNDFSLLKSDPKILIHVFSEHLMNLMMIIYTDLRYMT